MRAGPPYIRERPARVAAGTGRRRQRAILSRIAQLDQWTALADECLHSAGRAASRRTPGLTRTTRHRLLCYLLA